MLCGVWPVATPALSAGSIRHPLAESLVERAIATIFTPLELKVTDQDAVAFPSPSGIKSPIDTSHFENASETLIRLKVVPVRHLRETFDRFSSDDERIRSVFDGEFFDRLPVGSAMTSIRDLGCPFVLDRRKGAKLCLNVREEFFDTLSSDRRDAMRDDSILVEHLLHLKRSFRRFYVVNLVQGDDFWLVE